MNSDYLMSRGELHRRHHAGTCSYTYVSTPRKKVHKLVKFAIRIALGSRLFCLILGFETLYVFTRFIRCKEALWSKSNRGSLRTAWSSLLHQ